MGSLLKSCWGSLRTNRTSGFVWIGGGGVFITGCLWVMRSRILHSTYIEGLSKALCSITTGKKKRGKKPKVDRFKDYTKEERDWWRAQKEAEKCVQLASLQKAMGGDADLTIAIDMSFGEDAQMDKECRSLTSQLAYAYNYVRTSTTCAALHLTSYSGTAREALTRRGAEGWLAHRHEEDLSVAFADRLQDLVFLSPDAENTLDKLDRTKVYVIGGLVDKTVKKGASLRRAESLNAATVRLPVNEYVPREAQGRGHVLNINTAVHLLLKLHETQDWAKAFDLVLNQEEGTGTMGEKKAAEARRKKGIGAKGEKEGEGMEGRNQEEEEEIQGKVQG